MDNKYSRAKERVYDALWELCEYDDDVYQNACSGLGRESVMEDLFDVAAKLDAMSQYLERMR